MGPIFALFAIANALASTPKSNAVSPILDSLLGHWTVHEITAVKQSTGFETWSVGIPNRMYLERYDAGLGVSRSVGTAAIWQTSMADWRGVWCTQPQGCIQLRVEVRARELIVHADESAPAELQGVTERFRLSSRNRLEQILEACSATGVCQRITTVLGRRR